MRILLFAVAAAAIASGPALAQQTQAPAPAPPAAPSPPASKPAQADVPKDEASRCFRETYVGTIIGERVCRTASEREADNRAATAMVDANKEAVRQFTQDLLTVPGDGAVSGLQ